MRAGTGSLRAPFGCSDPPWGRVLGLDPERSDAGAREHRERCWACEAHAEGYREFAASRAEAGKEEVERVLARLRKTRR